LQQLRAATMKMASKFWKSRVIKFGLSCENDHDFDGWFGSSEEFESQQKRGLVTCPACNSAKVSKSLMAPNVSTSRKKESRSEAVALATGHQVQSEMMEKLREMRDEIVKNSDDVGEKFPEEARKIHYGEVESRGIYGQAAPDDVKELVDEGINIAPLPVFPEDTN